MFIITVKFYCCGLRDRFPHGNRREKKNRIEILMLKALKTSYNSIYFFVEAFLYWLCSAMND